MLKPKMLARATALALIALTSGAAYAEDPIKIGLLEDSSGDFGPIGAPKVRGSELAVEEINKAGGIMGRQIDLIYLDPQTDNARYQEFARRLIDKDKVDVLIGGIASAAREALRPIVDKGETPYFYTNQYEGGVCDANTFATGAVPEQQFSTLIPYMVKKFGPKVYVIAPDYNFGHLASEWNKQILAQDDVKGTLVGEEFIPMGVSQFAQTIQNIQKAKPDWILAVLTGRAQDSYFEQAAAANLNIPLASSVKVMVGWEHKLLPPPALSGLHVTANWYEELDTPAAEAFKKKWHAKYPNETYINDMGYNAYWTIYLYKEMVERAKSTKLQDMRKAVAQGDVCIEASEGKICMDPKSQHMSHNMYLLSVNDKHEVKREEDLGVIQPFWLASVGCDLTKNNPQEQYSPDNLPQN